MSQIYDISRTRSSLKNLSGNRRSLSKFRDDRPAHISQEVSRLQGKEVFVASCMLRTTTTSTKLDIRVISILVSLDYKIACRIFKLQKHACNGLNCEGEGGEGLGKFRNGITICTAVA